MTWRQKATEVLADCLRFIMKGSWLVSGIFISLFAVWFVGKFLLYTVDWVNKTLFSSPW